MEKTKRIIALILLVASVIFFIASLVGIVFTWVYRQQFSVNASSRLGSIEADLVTAQADLQAAKTELDSTQLQIDALQRALETLGLKGAEDIQAIGELVGKLEDTLVPIISAVADRVKGFQEAIDKLKDTIEKLNQLPLVDLEIPGIEQLEDASTRLEDIYSQVVDGRQKVSDVTELTRDTVASLTTGFAELEGSVQTLSATLGAYSAKISAYQAEVDYLQANLPRWINTAAVLLTVLLMWLAFSQLALFVLAWSFYKGEDLLMRWR
jgi:TolA-binding protein